MFNRPSTAFIFSIVAISLAACQSTAAPSPAAAPTSAPATTSAATPTPPRQNVAPTEEPIHAVKAGSLKSLLEYVSPTWADSHGWGVIGPALHFFDIAQMREDLDISPTLTGADEFKAKIDLILGVNSQGFSMAPLGIKEPDAFERWGWDIADLDQALCFEDDWTTILRGDFSRPEIKERFVEQGYRLRPAGEFMLYLKDEEPLCFAQTSDLMIISTSPTVIESLIERKTSGRPGLDRDPAMKAFMNQLNGAWGAFLAPRGDAGAYSGWLYWMEELYGKSKDPIRSWLDQWKDQQPQIAWDVMAVGWRGSPSTHALTFLYSYPSPAEAEKDVELVKAALTESPAFAAARTWANLLQLDSVEVHERILAATASTTSDELIAHAQRDENWGFLPVRPVPAEQAVAEDWSSPDAEVTELGSGWMLYRVEAEGFAIALPADWVHFDLGATAMVALLENMREVDPEAAGAIEEEARMAAAAGIKFYAFNLKEVTANGMANLLIIKSPDEGMPLEIIARMLLNQYRDSAVTEQPIERQRVHLPTGAAEQIQVHQKSDDPLSGSFDITITHYVLVENGYAYVITFAAPYEQAADYNSTFAEIIQTFRLVK
ncbi:MAG TPA: hypothetical protein VJG32_07365 [Anaerolineae bacterium]|nr:hypothetical protein [Anaerolineae bacterium]